MRSAPNDGTIVDECTRVTREADCLLIEVAHIAWDGPHTPVTTWVTCAVLPLDAAHTSISAARFALLEERGHFRICRVFKERKPCGGMHDGRVCQSCAERDFGVIH